MEDCEAIQYISPIYFASFVLLSQFVLLNVVVAVLMKHLEESKFADKITINEQSLRTTKLFLERGFPDSFRATKNSTSMRCHKSESGIQRRERSVSFRGVRRTKSLDEIRNNNLGLDFNSDHDFDCFSSSIKIKRGTKSLRQRKPSVEDENVLEHVEIFTIV